MASVENFKNALELTTISEGKSSQLNITTSDMNRPGLQLAGFWDYFAYERPQVLGKVEMTFQETLEPDVRQARFDKFFTYDIPCMIICRSIRCPEVISAGAQKAGIWLFSSMMSTGKFIINATNYLNNYLAPRITRHGVLVDVYGVGMMITGESGVGKSEAALELVKRGHRLVADDVVDIKRVSDRRLVGESPGTLRHYMEIRGIGIIDISAMYGIASVIDSKTIDLVVNLELWRHNKEYDRLGLTEETTEILGVKVPILEMPIRPGRNLAIVLEVAARNFRLKEMGYNAARELDKRLMARIAHGGDDDDDE